METERTKRLTRREEEQERTAREDERKKGEIAANTEEWRNGSV
jgi:hypothetical protein